MAKAAGPAEGYALLRNVLQEFDERCAAAAKANAKGEPVAGISATVSSVISDVRQALEEEALTGKPKFTS